MTKRFPLPIGLGLVLLFAAPNARSADLYVQLFWASKPTIGEAYTHCMAETDETQYGSGNNNYVFLGCSVGVDQQGYPAIVGESEWDSSYWGRVHGSSFTRYSTGCSAGLQWNSVTQSCENPTVKPELNLGQEHCPAGTPTNSCGNPINTATGNKHQFEQDLAPVGLLEFGRYYNSATAAAGDLLGPRWSHSYSRKVRTRSNSAADVMRPDGRSISFSLTSGSWSPVLGQSSKLAQTRNSSGALVGWTFQEVDARESEEFDLKGRLRAVSRANGSAISLEYNGGIESGTAADYLLTKVTAHDGRSLTFSYDPVGRIDRITQGDGQFFSYAYTAGGMLQTVTYPGGSSRNYLYNEPSWTSGANLPFALTGVQDERSRRFASFAYYPDGRAKSTEHAGGVDRYSVSYGNATSLIVEPLGATQSRAIASVAGILRASSIARSDGTVTRTSTFQYDAAGRTDLVTDAGGIVTDYDFSGAGQLTRLVEASNVPAIKRTTETDWHAAFSVPIETRVRDSAGTIVSKTTWTYNSRGQVLTETRHDPSGQLATRTTTYSYCDQVDTNPVPGSCPFVGLLQSIDGPRTDVSDLTTFTYYYDSGCSDAGGACWRRKGDLWTVTNPLHQSTVFLTYNDRGQPTRLKDINGVFIDLEYSTRGWLTARKVRGDDDLTEVDDAITRLEYEPTGDIKRVTLPDGVFAAFTRDDAHRVTQITDAMGNTVHYLLDNAGNPRQEDFKDGLGVLKHTLSRVYNSLNELKSLADASSTPIDFSYAIDGSLDLTTDRLLRVTDEDSDALGRVTQVIANTGGGTSDRAVTGHKYNALDKLTEVTDPKGLLTKYGYNGFGEQNRLESPDTGVSRFTSNENGDVVEAIDARGVTSAYSYDRVGRLTSQTVPTGSQNVYFDYDNYWYAWSEQDLPLSDCMAGETYGKGRLAGVRDESGTTRYCYDRLGNPARKVQTVTGGSKLTVELNHNWAGRLIAMTYPSGAIVTYLRDQNGNVRAIDTVPATGQPQATLVSAVSYLPYGPLHSITYGNGRVLTKAYDSNYQVDKVSDSAASNPLSEDFTLDAGGRVKALSERTSVSVVAGRAYAYDGLDRLTTHKDGNQTVEGFGYDATGNRLSKTLGKKTSNYSYPANSHRLSAVGPIARTYDSNGNLQAISPSLPDREFMYDDHNRLRDFKVSGIVRASYRYNGKGEQVLRIDTTAGANSRQYVYDEGGRLLGEYTTAGLRIQEYVWLDDTLIGILSDHDGSTYQFVQTDHLGTPRAVINPVNNSIIWRWNISNTAFGDHLPLSDPDANGSNFILNLRYPGQRADPISGLNYNYFRDYEPGTGRFTQSDPIGLEGGTSTYSYANGNPLDFADPLGLLACRREITNGPIYPMPDLVEVLDKRELEFSTPVIRATPPGFLDLMTNLSNAMRRRPPTDVAWEYAGDKKYALEYSVSRVTVMSAYDATYYEVCTDDCGNVVSRTPVGNNPYVSRIRGKSRVDRSLRLVPRGFRLPPRLGISHPSGPQDF